MQCNNFILLSFFVLDDVDWSKRDMNGADPNYLQSLVAIKGTEFFNFVIIKIHYNQLIHQIIII